jgi:hypothetical protein
MRIALAHAALARKIGQAARAMAYSERLQHLQTFDDSRLHVILQARATLDLRDSMSVFDIFNIWNRVHVPPRRLFNTTFAAL